MESHRKGELTEAIVVAELKQREIPVSRPFGDNERYDVVAETPDGSLLKLQVKTGRLSRGAVVFDGVSMHTNAEGNVYKPYDGDVDQFVVYSHDLEELYLVPEGEVGSSMALRVDAPKQSDPKINPAATYRFDENWPPDVDGSARSKGRDETVRAVTEAFEAIGVSVYRADGERACVVAEGEHHYRVRPVSVSEQDGRLRATSLPNDTPADHYALYWSARERTHLVETGEFGSSLSLRLSEPEQVRSDTRLAADYRLEAVWPPDGRPVRGSQSALGAVRDEFESMDVPVGIVNDESVPYDLLAERGDEFARLAVVTGHVSRGCLRLKPGSCDGVDAFVVYHREGDTCYVVEADAFDRSISLRVTAPEKPDRSINWAAAYELADAW